MGILLHCVSYQSSIRTKSINNVDTLRDPLGGQVVYFRPGGNYRNSFNVSATIFFYFSLFGDFQSDVLPIFSANPCTTDMFYISFESSNIELPESEVKMGVALSRGLPRPLKCDYLLRATIFQGRLILKELR